MREKNIETYIPHTKNSGVNLDDFIYDKKADTYKDKEWNIFKLKQYVWSLTWRKRWRPKKWEILREEDFESKLASESCSSTDEALAPDVRR